MTGAILNTYVKEIEKALLDDDQDDEQSTPPNTGGT